MNIPSTLSVTVLALLVLLYEWPHQKNGAKRDRAALIGITITAWVLLIMICFFPRMPGLSQLIEAVFKPLMFLVN